MNRRIVVSLGRHGAGDDAVGAAVLAELRRRAVPELELLDLADAAHLVTLLVEGHRLVLVDAILGTPPGRVLEPAPDQLAASPRALALHGFGAAAAIALARALAASIEIRIVGITIAPPAHGIGLSPEVEAAVPAAADRVVAACSAQASR
jgi:hydrogenase maturation protease